MQNTIAVFKRKLEFKNVLNESIIPDCKYLKTDCNASTVVSLHAKGLKGHCNRRAVTSID
jgi:hypothetical protein